MRLLALHWLWRYWQGAWRRWSLWTLLVALVAAMLVTLVWLAGRYEASVVQAQLERDAMDPFVSEEEILLASQSQADGQELPPPGVAAAALRCLSDSPFVNSSSV